MPKSPVAKKVDKRDAHFVSFRDDGPQYIEIRDGWPGSGFKRMISYAHIRDVSAKRDDGTEEAHVAQLSFEVTKLYDSARRSESGSLSLPRAEALEMAQVLAASLGMELVEAQPRAAGMGLIAETRANV